MSQTCMQCGSFADNGKICDDCVEKNERSFRSTRPFSAEQQAIIEMVAGAAAAVVGLALLLVRRGRRG